MKGPRFTCSVKTQYLPEQSQLHPYLTCAETLDLFAKLHSVPRTERRARR